jgi:hypothetical protein
MEFLALVCKEDKKPGAMEPYSKLHLTLSGRKFNFEFSGLRPGG